MQPIISRPMTPAEMKQIARTQRKAARHALQPCPGCKRVEMVVCSGNKFHCHGCGARRATTQSKHQRRPRRLRARQAIVYIRRAPAPRPRPRAVRTTACRHGNSEKGDGSGSDGDGGGGDPPPPQLSTTNKHGLAPLPQWERR